MTERASAPILFDPFGFWSRSFVQPILPGWHFGDVVTQYNSSSPETERRILAQESYGRQIGRLLDAVCELIQQQPGAKSEAFRDLLDLKKRVDELKAGALEDRLDQLRRDLARLKSRDPEAYRRTVEAVRAMLPK